MPSRVVDNVTASDTSRTPPTDGWGPKMQRDRRRLGTKMKEMKVVKSRFYFRADICKLISIVVLSFFVDRLKKLSNMLSLMVFYLFS